MISFYSYIKKLSMWIISRFSKISKFLFSKHFVSKRLSTSNVNFIEFNFTQNLPGLRLDFNQVNATEINCLNLSSNNRCSFQNNSSQVELIARHLREAQRSIDVAVYSFSEHILNHLILQAYRRGLRVRFLTDAASERTPGSSISILRANGVLVRTNATGQGASDRNLLHLKFAGRHLTCFN